MPELPEVEALASFLREHASGRAVVRTDVAALSAVKTFDPPLAALQGAVISGASRYGKFLSVDFDQLHLITHFSRAGWLHWRENLSPAPPKLGRGPLALRVHLSPDDAGQTGGWDLTEAGTQKRLAVYLVSDPQQVPGIARLGPDAMALSREEFASVLSRTNQQIKRALSDQSLIAGIGNAYSDEILHTAKLSPFKASAKLGDEEITELHAAMIDVLTDAVARSVGQKAATLKAEKRTGLRVHGRNSLPCPVCGDTIKSVSFSDRSFQYCPTCQTEGRGLADRRLSRLLK
ncbi:MAG TPA: DNA-formamidopyrimidine glycosylase family protein [Jatrophihabitans sp.]|jgi:formamidopyrimidine-DNA glycosylase